ncbi:MAG: 2-keto-4-pentenoate hydratase [Planctomycetota bacterium]
MSQPDNIAELFLKIWKDKRATSECTFDLGSVSIDDAYEVQRRVISARVAEGERVVGYKVGCTSRAIQQQFGLSEPICGRVMAPHVRFGNTLLNWNEYVECAVEPEFVLGIGEDVAAKVEDETKLLEAIEWVASGIEIHNYKFWCGEPTLQELIASNGIHRGWSSEIRESHQQVSILIWRVWGSSEMESWRRPASVPRSWAGR